MDLSISKGFKKRLYNCFVISIIFGIVYLISSIILNYFSQKEELTDNNYSTTLYEEWEHSTSTTDGLIHGQEVNGWVLDLSGENYDYSTDADVKIGKDDNAYTNTIDMDVFFESAGEEIILRKRIVVEKNKLYEVSVDIDVDTDDSNLEKYFIRMFADPNSSKNSRWTLLPAVDSSVENTNGAFHNISGSYFSQDTILYIELVCTTTSVTDDSENRVRWGPVLIKLKKCPSSKCKFDACKSPVVPRGKNISTGESWTGTKRDGVLDLPSEAIDGTSYYYKHIPQTCDPDVQNCYDNDCGNCDPGYLYIDKTTEENVGYKTPDDVDGTIKKVDACTGRTYGSIPETGTSVDDTNNEDLGIISGTAKTIANLFTGGFKSAKGLLFVAGGGVQALGGGLYAVFDQESGEATVVDGLGNAQEGGGKVIDGLIEAGKLPVDAVFNIDLKKIGNRDIKDVISDEGAAAESNSSLDSNAEENTGYVPYEASITF